MADIILESEIKQIHIPKVLDTLDIFSDGFIRITLNDRTDFQYKFLSKQPGESEKDFGERFQKFLWLACLRIRAKLNKKNAIQALTEAISVEEEVVDNDTIT